MPRRVVAAAIQLGHNAGMLVAAEVGSFEAPGRVGPGAWCAVHESVLLWLRGCPYLPPVTTCSPAAQQPPQRALVESSLVYYLSYLHVHLHVLHTVRVQRVRVHL
jgi:hypothetical protein